MNRNDWVFVGMRLFGLFLVVQSILGMPDVLMASRLGWAGVGTPLLSAALSMLTGVVLLLGAPWILGWFEEKDARLKLPNKPIQTDTAPPRR